MPRRCGKGTRFAQTALILDDNKLDFIDGNDLRRKKEVGHLNLDSY